MSEEIATGFSIAPDWLKQGVTIKAKTMHLRISTFDTQLKIAPFYMVEEKLLVRGSFYQGFFIPRMKVRRMLLVSLRAAYHGFCLILVC